MNKKPEMIQKQRIQVFARCRPLNNIEKKQLSPSIVEVIPEKKEIIVKDRNTNREFFFDKVFTPDTKQITVYKAVVGPLIREVLSGYNCTVFAYGQTGTGKTYTMEGERSNAACSWEDDPGAGIIPRSLHQLFEELNKEENVEFSVRVSFLELYNEELFDLLSSAELSRLRLFEDSSRKGSVIIQGLEEIIVNSKDEVYAILEKGTARRQTAATILNATSSRSHTVFSVTVHIKENTVDGEELLKTGKLNLVDLAGSENVGRSGAVDKRAREAGNINQSLLTLGRVITSLIEKQPHVPYRESKLTRLLQDSLGGHTKTSIIATISPALCNSDETLSTLDYATKAKSITIKPEANQRMEKKALIREYSEEIERLRRDLAALRNKEGFYIDSDNYTRLLNEVIEKKDLIKYLQDKIDLLKEELRKAEELFSTTNEKYMKKSEELDQTSKKYKETEMELINTTNALSYSQKVLSETTLERDEKQYLINIHSKTEKKLLQQAQTLLQVADQSTNDNDKLHAKIERKQNVEKSNEELFRDFKTIFQQQFAEFDALVADTEAKQIGSLEEIETKLGDFVQHLTKSQQQTTVCLSDVVDCLNMSMTNFSTCLSMKAAEQSQSTESLLQGLSDRATELSAEQKVFLSKTLPTHLDQMNTMHSQMKDWFITAHTALCEKIELQKEVVRKQAQDKNTLICAIQKRLASFSEHHAGILLKLAQKSHENYIVQTAHKKNFDEKVQDLEQCISNTLEKLNSLKNIGKQQENINVNAHQIEEISLEAKNHLPCLRAMDEPLTTVFELKEFQTIEAGLDDISSAIKPTEFFENEDLILQKEQSVIKDIEMFLKEQEKTEMANSIKLKTELQSDCSSVMKRFESSKNLAKEIQSSLEEYQNNLKYSFERDCDKIQASKFKAENLVSTTKENLRRNVKQMKDEILKSELEFEKFFFEDLRKDVPTGTTPQRSSYTYPKVLVTTSPHDRILQRYRSKLAADTAVAVNLPLDSSFNVQEDDKSSTLTDFTSGVFDVSSASDGSEDTETNSWASSMSDVSVDSNTNKENKPRKKASRLPKRVKSTKVFIKPAPPIDRRPLILTNSDLEN